jgi:hypothetical protein
MLITSAISIIAVETAFIDTRGIHEVRVMNVWWLFAALHISLVIGLFNQLSKSFK